MPAPLLFCSGATAPKTALLLNSATAVAGSARASLAFVASVVTHALLVTIASRSVMLVCAKLAGQTRKLAQPDQTCANVMTPANASARYDMGQRSYWVHVHPFAGLRITFGVS